jgi:hypothetical protein
MGNVKDYKLGSTYPANMSPTGAGAPSVKHETVESPHSTPTYTESPDPRTARPGGGGGPDMKSMIDQHREFRKEVEKPMNVTVKQPPATHVRQMASRQHSRWSTNAEHQAQRHHSPGDIGFATLICIAAIPVIMSALNLIQCS